MASQSWIYLGNLGTKLKFMGALDTQRSATPNLKQAHPYFPGNCLVKLG